MTTMTLAAGMELTLPPTTKAFSATVGALGIATVYLTDDGTITGVPLFSSVICVNARFTSNDPNLGVSYTLSGNTVTLNCVKQTFSGVVVLGVTVLGGATLNAAPVSTTLLVQVTGMLA